MVKKNKDSEQSEALQKESEVGTFKLSSAEEQRIKEVRKFDLVEPGTIGYDLLRTADSLRIQKRKAERFINLNMSAVFENYKLMKEAKLKLDNKDLMDKDDSLISLKADHRKYHTSILTMVDNILINFVELMSVVDRKDGSGKTIIDKKTFEVLLDETNQEIKRLGYDLLE